MKKRYQCMHAFVNIYVHVYAFVCHAYGMCLYIYMLSANVIACVHVCVFPLIECMC